MYSGLTCGAQLGDVVVVYGVGFAGQIIAQAAKRKGAYRVVAIDLADGKLDLAKRLGCDVVINPRREDPVQAVLELTGGRGADVVVEAAGSEQSMNQASAMLKHNGILALYSWITQPVTLNLSRWHDDGFDIRSTCLVHHTPEERKVWTPWALRPVIQGMVNIRPLITHEFPLDRIADAFRAADTDATAIKVVVRTDPIAQANFHIFCKKRIRPKSGCVQTPCFKRRRSGLPDRSKKHPEGSKGLTNLFHALMNHSQDGCAYKGSHAPAMDFCNRLIEIIRFRHRGGRR